MQALLLPYNSDYMEEGSSYDVNALLNKAIDGYTWIRYEGGQSAGSLNGDHGIQCIL